MPKCWIHGSTAKKEPTKPLKEHPGWPENNNYRQNLNILFTGQTKKDLDFRILQEKNAGLIEQLEEQKQFFEKSEQKLLTDFNNERKILEGEIDQWQINYQFLQQKKDEQIADLENKLTQLIARIMNISEKPTGTFDPKLLKQKGIKELLERYSVSSLEELVAFIDKKGEGKSKVDQELEQFLKDNRANNLNDIGIMLVNYKKGVEDLKEKIKQLKEKREGMPKDYEDLEVERDELARDKITLEQETLTLSNRLKNKSSEIENKEKTIQQLKKEKSEVETRLNKSLTELKTKYSRQGQLLDEEQLESKRLEEEVEKLEEKVRNLESARASLLEPQKTYQEWEEEGALNEKITSGSWTGYTYADASKPGASSFRDIASNLTQKWKLEDLKRRIKQYFPD